MAQLLQLGAERGEHLPADALEQASSRLAGLERTLVDLTGGERVYSRWSTRCAAGRRARGRPRYPASAGGHRGAGGTRPDRLSVWSCISTRLQLGVVLLAVDKVVAIDEPAAAGRRSAAGRGLGCGSSVCGRRGGACGPVADSGGWRAVPAWDAYKENVVASSRLIDVLASGVALLSPRSSSPPGQCRHHGAALYHHAAPRPAARSTCRPRLTTMSAGGSCRRCVSGIMC